jgi:hypothetical protein
MHPSLHEQLMRAIVAERLARAKQASRLPRPDARTPRTGWIRRARKHR